MSLGVDEKSAWLHLSDKKAIFLFSLVAIVIYLPAFLIEFGLHNDYIRWAYKGLLGYPETADLVTVARPLGALLINLQFYPIDKISGLSIARFVTFVFSACLSLMIAWYLKVRFKKDGVFTFAVSISILTLPPIQLYIVWANNFVPGSLNILLSLVSYLVLDKAEENRGSSRIKLVALAAVIYLSSILIYPPTALSFLLFTLSRVLFTDFNLWQETRKRVARDIAFAVSGMIITFGIYRALVLPVLTANFESIEAHFNMVMKHPVYSLRMSTDLHDKALHFYDLSKIALAGVWHPAFGANAALAVLIFIFFGGGFLIWKVLADTKNRVNPILS